MKNGIVRVETLWYDLENLKAMKLSGSTSFLSEVGPFLRFHA
jgi:hypothetical protein